MSGTPLVRWTVTPDVGEPFLLEALSRDVLVWERTVRNASYATLMRQSNMVDMYRLAHIAAMRTGLFTGDLATFETTCDLEPAPEDEDAESEADSPTRPAQ